MNTGVEYYVKGGQKLSSGWDKSQSYRWGYFLRGPAAYGEAGDEQWHCFARISVATTLEMIVPPQTQSAAEISRLFGDGSFRGSVCLICVRVLL